MLYGFCPYRDEGVGKPPWARSEYETERLVVDDVRSVSHSGGVPGFPALYLPCPTSFSAGAMHGPVVRLFVL